MIGLVERGKMSRRKADAALRVGVSTVISWMRRLIEFREIYNATWLIERHGFMSPAEFRQRQLQPAALAA